MTRASCERQSSANGMAAAPVTTPSIVAERTRRPLPLWIRAETHSARSGSATRWRIWAPPKRKHGHDRRSTLCNKGRWVFPSGSTLTPMMKDMTRSKLLQIWFTAMTLIVVASIAIGVSVTVGVGATMLALCLVPPAIALMLWPGAQPITAARSASRRSS
jgi:hypothetical protein